MLKKRPQNFEIPPENEFLELTRVKLLNVKSNLLGLEAAANFSKEDFIKSFRMDNRNFDALFGLVKSSLMTLDELKEFVDSNVQKVMLKEILHEILSIKTNCINFSSFLLELECIRNYGKRNKEALFRNSIVLVDEFPESEAGYTFLGFYYVSVKNFQESKKLFYTSLKININNFRGILGLGYSYSKLKDSASSIVCFKKASNMVEGCYLPFYYLCGEYNRSGNMIEAEKFIKIALTVSENKENLKSNALILFKRARYAEIPKILNRLTDHPILKIMMYVYMGNYIDAEANLQEMEKNWKYFSLLGYISHLKGNIELAEDNYMKACLEGGSNSVLLCLMNKIEAKNSGESILAEIDSVFNFVMETDDHL